MSIKISRKIHVGNIIKKARLSKGMTQDNLSICTGIPQARISSYENKKSGHEFKETMLIFNVLGITLGGE